MQDTPLVSVITPCLNRAGMIREAIESVCKQDYENIEHIIVDGGSKDGTLEILREYKHLKVISEPDKNLYDGLNKGIALATGEIIAHLNSDDCFSENCFANIVNHFNHHKDIDSVCGGASVFEKNHFEEKKYKATYNAAWHKDLSLENITYGMPIINSRFFRKRVYDKIGHYDIQYPVAADREFLMRAYIAGIKSIQIENIIYHYRHHEGSLTINNLNKPLSDELHPEYLKILMHYRNMPNLPKEVLRACRDWHTWMVGYNMLSYLKALDIPSSIRMFKKGNAEDKWFFLRYFMQRIKQKSLNKKVSV